MLETTELRELTRKRGGVNHKLTNFVKHVVPIYNTFKINPSLDDEVIIELQNRLDKLEIIYNEFEGIQLEIESLSPDDVLEGHYEERDENLELDEIPVNISINGASNVIANVRSKCNVRLASMHNNFNLKLSCYVLPTITGCLPNVEVNISDWKLPDNVCLADPKFNIPKQIDLLTGASHFWRIVRAGIIHLGKGMPVLQNTEFGYTVTGQINNKVGGLNKSGYCLVVRGRRKKNKPRRGVVSNNFCVVPLPQLGTSDLTVAIGNAGTYGKRL
ncbi:hypothetical protein ILUMI_11710 [Ignelater luminosus]|uniref:Peptidase aspartic putative domain-containing protein n=1 Tax=Ignelater luminosus TaxID=2038154 RepID=A0A8K0GD00_IGNLU|nr:hypothetical protein ILUMI_11710 [Ignelater luminosus]